MSYHLRPQAYHDLLPYTKFALFYDISEIPFLPSLLKRISAQDACKMRQAAAMYYRALTWQEEGGRAYEMLQLSLCRRAAALYQNLQKTKRRAGNLPSWIDCTTTSAEDILKLK